MLLRQMVSLDDILLAMRASGYEVESQTVANLMSLSEVVHKRIEYLFELAGVEACHKAILAVVGCVYIAHCLPRLLHALTFCYVLPASVTKWN